jgi:hypothetical protein
MKQKINIKCCINISEDKIKVIKMLREAFHIGLKDAKELADKFHQSETIIYEPDKKYSIKDLNKNHSKDIHGNQYLQFSGGQYHNGFSREALLEKIKFFASLALDNNESHLAEDLLRVYNKYEE